jgi:hypothetical protein
MRIAGNRRTSHIDDPVVRNLADSRNSTRTTGEEMYEKVTLSEAALAQREGEAADADDAPKKPQSTWPGQFSPYSGYGWPAR